MNREEEKHPVEQIAEACGGTITDGGLLPDGSGFAVMSMPLPKTHWIYGKNDPLYDAPPMPLKMGLEDRAMVIIGKSDDPNDAGLPVANGITLTRAGFASMIREAGRYAVRSATMNGTEMDFDPDALIQNLVTGMLGYHTADGLTGLDDWANPPKYRKEPE